MLIAGGIDLDREPLGLSCRGRPRYRARENAGRSLVNRVNTRRVDTLVRRSAVGRIDEEIERSQGLRDSDDIDRRRLAERVREHGGAVLLVDRAVAAFETLQAVL